MHSVILSDESYEQLQEELEELRGIVARKEFRATLEQQAQQEQEIRKLREALEFVVDWYKDKLPSEHPVVAKARDALGVKEN